MKSSVEEIRARFDNDVERFSNLTTGQQAQIDAPLIMDLLTTAAAAVTPRAQHIVDIGCGAGNYTLKLLQALGTASQPGPACPEVTLIDLSQPMLDRAVQRIADAFPHVTTHATQCNVRDFNFGDRQYDVVIAAQCLHHLRGDEEWERVFRHIFKGLSPGGSFWIADSLEHDHATVRRLMWDRWGEYLTGLKDSTYRDAVYAYVEKEDSPRPLLWQLELLRRVGFAGIDVLHVHSRFGCFGAVRA